MKDLNREQIGTAVFRSLKECWENVESLPSESEIQSFVEYPQDSSKGDLAFPCFRLAKVLRMGPPQIAAKLTEHLSTQLNEWSLKSVEGVSGFLNFKFDKNILAAKLIPEIDSDAFFNPPEKSECARENVMVEFSQPNTHKEFHVGHGRNVCLGDSITRLFRYCGYKTLGVNYIGDEGTHIAKCLLAVTLSDEKIPNEKRAEWLGHKYVEGNNLVKEDPDKWGPQVSQILAAIESKSGDMYELWRKTKEYCMQDFRDIYKWLDVPFDHYFYESEVSEEAQSVVKRYLDRGVFKEDQGAIGLDMSDDKLGFFMARKSDGNTLYITKDISLAEKKFSEYEIHKNIYVVGSEQEFHFKQLFNFFKLAGFERAKDCYHLSYGMVRRADGKMSSRLGNSFTFLELIEILNTEIDKYLDKYQGEWTAEEIENIRHRLAVGAIKYGMLGTDPKKDIVFEPDNWTRFDGNSGPYLMYSFSRTHSILQRAKAEGLSANCTGPYLWTHQTEESLVYELSKFNQIVWMAMEARKPSLLAQYLYELCKTYNQFYVQVPIFKEADASLKSQRLGLLSAFSKVLSKGLSLLGITPPNKM